MPASMTSTPSQTLSRDQVADRLAEYGYRLTSPRLHIVDAVLAHSRPFTAEGLVAELQESAAGASIGRATVYRTLELLASVDVLTRIVSPEGHPSYICGYPGHRHHLLCEQCGSTVTFTACPVDGLIRDLAEQTHFRIKDHVLEVFGVCPQCQTR